MEILMLARKVNIMLQPVCGWLHFLMADARILQITRSFLSLTLFLCLLLIKSRKDGDDEKAVSLYTELAAHHTVTRAIRGSVYKIQGGSKIN